MLGTHNCSSNFYATCASWKLVSSAFFQITSFALLCSECLAAISSTFLLMPLWVMTCAISAKQTYDPLNKKGFNAYFSAILCGFEVRKIDFRRENRYFYPLKIELWCLRKKCIWPKYQNSKCLLDLFFQVSLRRTVKSSPIFVVLLSWRSQQEAALSEVENGICCCHWLISASAALSMEGKQRA